MAEMFGAPVGQQAYANTQMVEAQTLSSLGELYNKTLLAPLERDLKAAQRLEQLSLAGKHNAETAKLTDEANVRNIVRLASNDATLLTGLDKVGEPGKVDAKGKPFSAMDHMELTIQRARERGASNMDILQLIEKYTLGRQQEAETGHRQAQEASQRAIATAKKMENAGRFATYALENPQNFRNVLMQGSQDPELGALVANLPMDFTAAKPILQAMQAESMTAAERAKAEAEKSQASSAQTRAQAAVASAQAAVATAAARVDLLKERTRILKKADGEGSQATRDLKAVQTEAARDKQDRENLKVFKPIAGFDQKTAQPGSTWETKMGKMVYRGLNEAGKPVFDVFKNTRSRAAEMALEDAE